MEKVGVDFLSVSDLSEGFHGSKIAFLQRVKRLWDRNDEPYLNFIFRTIDLSTVIGRKFRVTRDNQIGNEILQAQRRPVSITFETQLWRGSYVLLIEHIALASESYTSNFFESFEYADSLYDLLTAKCVKYNVPKISQKIKTLSFTSVLDGKQGGILHVLDSTFSSLSALKGENFYPTLLIVLLECITPYIIYCQLLDKAEFVPKSEQFSLLHHLNRIEQEDIRAISMDTLSALVGICSPEHYISHIIYDNFIFALKQLNLLEKIKSSPKNTYIDYEGRKIISY